MKMLGALLELRLHIDLNYLPYLLLVLTNHNAIELDNKGFLCCGAKYHDNVGSSFLSE